MDWIVKAILKIFRFIQIPVRMVAKQGWPIPFGQEWSVYRQTTLYMCVYIYSPFILRWFWKEFLHRKGKEGLNALLCLKLVSWHMEVVDSLPERSIRWQADTFLCIRPSYQKVKKENQVN
ncbi:hypothetical protein AAG906_029509 [Vitis piasezkii]